LFAQRSNFDIDCGRRGARTSQHPTSDTANKKAISRTRESLSRVRASNSVSYSGNVRQQAKDSPSAGTNVMNRLHPRHWWPL
jgi:hypothetical protein